MKKVFYGEFQSAVEILNFTCDEESGDIILKGQCAKCDHEVVRVIETSEMNFGNN